MNKRFYFLLIVGFVLMAGCSKNMIVNVDGMPISNHEYQLTNSETGIRTVFVLTQYYREYEGDEYLVKPRYLDALAPNQLKSEKTERLGLHVKVVNINKARYSLLWGVREPDGAGFESALYHGKLSRRDFYLALPFEKEGDYDFWFVLKDEEGTDLFMLPDMGYKVKGGVVKSSTYNSKK